MKNFKIAVFTIFAILALTAPTAAQAVQSGSKTPATVQQSPANTLVKATQEYKASLDNLASSYASSATQAEERLKQLKALYDEGVLSRKEYEAAQLVAASARTKVEETRKQISEADLTIAAALKPKPAEGGWTGTPGVTTSWSTGNAKYDALIRENGKRFGVDPYLIFCVMEQESHFNASATSPVGAQGLMQLMPGTAARFGVANAYDAGQSIAGGTRYLKQLLQMFNGKIDLVLASYNAGEGAVMKYGGKIPPFKETVAYVRAIGTRYGWKAK
jgi:soluble lytic murein transglycosylase-like protein